jgi:hypothetical protein
MRTRTAALLGAFGLALAMGTAASEDAQACSCIEQTPRALKRSFRTSDAAFVGRVVRIEMNTATPRGGSRAAPLESTYRFRVERRYKGRLGREVSVVVGGACDPGLRRGERTGLFLSRHPRTGRFESSACDVVTPAQMRRAARGSRARAGGCR